ncbi:MAG TPA: biliverdin-producing heme oxygenase [Microvirga sp.]|jgi:heme oxygenase|nr:biliverdin-producing heme oxygenase [Microvirga sp.]
MPLSLQLRAETAAAHRATETSVGLPGTIAGRDDYRACLIRFLRLYRPLEERLCEFSDWPHWGIDLQDRPHAARLVDDLGRLGVRAEDLPDAPAEALPALSTFAHALGALYVLEGSTLGGQLIFRRLLAAEIEGVAEACSFFNGRGAATGPLWRSFREALDAFGAAQPSQNPDVVEGAKRTFAAVGRWVDARLWRTA